MAHLGYQDGDELKFKCSASLISEYFLLTTAHCINPENPPVIARFGNTASEEEYTVSFGAPYSVVRVTQNYT